MVSENLRQDRVPSIWPPIELVEIFFVDVSLMITCCRDKGVVAAQDDHTI
jgi:hypothetical protein